MQEGAFALIDCLGFKGIWKRSQDNPDIVLNKLMQIDKDAKETEGRLKAYAENQAIKLEVNFVMLSDTIAISAPYFPLNLDKKIEDFHKGLLVQSVCMLASKFIQLFMLDEPYLALRGYVTFGQHSMKENFIVGPAVDEAAVNYEIADGAFVWLHPEATQMYENYKNVEKEIQQAVISKEQKQYQVGSNSVSKEEIAELYNLNSKLPLLIEYEMPIKNGKHLDCSVINPLLLLEGGEERAEVMLNHIESFKSNDINVLIKMQNTVEFLTKANIECEKFEEQGLNFNWLRKVTGVEDLIDTEEN